MFGKTETIFLVLRGADEAARSLREALANAHPEDRPGLELALRLVEEADARSETELRGHWVRRTLSEVGYAGPVDSVAAIKALRGAEPGLSLRSAVQLAKEAAALEA
ncbi:hypothetical protein HUT18_22575 [Streptomyces sp. NA04227]|uniref:hypothetical protein n=1 Tax=Streptomyces sp. NA04227 TaxID=2742136 RepID=UPI0015921D74|nr:hypothetical protein [Streptomyces sp. NA04227]QKW08745.1 hypothetical protein HUT18_22575 [Streptomyces sp. NA04227]